MRRIIGIISAALAIAAITAPSAATASAAQQQAPSLDTVGLGGRLGSGSGLEAPRRGPKTGDGSGGFIYRNGRYSPLDSVDGLITSHVAINNRGQTTGAYLRSELDSGGGPLDPGAFHGFVSDRSGDYRPFDVAPGPSTLPYDINDRGTTVGLYGNAVTLEGGSFLRKPNGDVSTVEVPGASTTGVGGINNRGALVGGYLDADGASRAFVMRGRRVTTLDPPGAAADPAAANVFVNDLNDRGQAVGCFADANGTYHGFRYDKVRFTRIDPPGAANVPKYATTCALGINNGGQVVGQYVDAAGMLHGYLWQRGRGFETIDLPRGAPLVGPAGDRGTIAADINDRGEILLPIPGGFYKGRVASIGG